MLCFSNLLIGLQAVIAARAARDRTLTVLLVALWGRLGRVATRLERLVALWRAGKLPAPRAPRGAVAGATGRGRAGRLALPTSAGWLRRKLGYEVGPYAAQLQNLLTDAECQAFLAAVPQAGRLLRPLLRMLSFDPVPDILRIAPHVAPVAALVVAAVGIVVAPDSQFLSA
jgi:hypothetical protein